MRYKDLDLAGISKILRAHATQIVPPGMRELKNLYLSRSDNAITLRPDFQQEITDMISLAASIQGDNLAEHLTGLYRALDLDSYIYFSNLGPFSSGLERENLSSIYKEGTVTTDGSTSVVQGTGTLWLQYTWAGCLIREQGSSDWYVIEAVKSDVYLTTTTPMPALTASDYEILRTHPAVNGAWPIGFERVGDLLVYNPMNPTLPVNRSLISGPFYANVGRSDSFGVWTEKTPDIGGGQVGKYIALNLPQAGPSYSLSHGFPNILLAVGENGFVTSLDHWASNFDDQDANWLKTKDAYHFWDANSDLTYPRGSSYPVRNTYKLIPVGSDAKPVGMDSQLIAFQDGTVVSLVMAAHPEELTEEEKLTNGPITTQRIFAPIKVIAPPCHGICNQVVFGGNGVIDFIYYVASIETGVTADIYGMCSGEIINLDPDYSAIDSKDLSYIAVGGVDDLGTTIVVQAGAGIEPELWERMDPTYFPDEEELYSVTYMHAMDEGSYTLGRYVAVGAKGTIWFSDDGGYFWDAATSGTIEHLRKVEADREGRCAMAVGDGGTCLTTVDGETWEPLVVTSKDIIDLGFDPFRGEFVFLKDAKDDPVRIKRRMRYGTAGVVPVKRIGIISSNPQDRVFSIIWDGSQFIAAGNKIWTSPTGVSWTVRNTPAGDVACLAHDGAGTVIAVGQEGMILRSANSGVAWSSIHAPLGNPDIEGPILSVIWDGYNFFCCGDNSILRSPTGAAWSTDTFDFNEQPVMMVYGGNNFQILYDEVSQAIVATDDVFGGYGGAQSLDVLCKSGAWFRCRNDVDFNEPEYSAWAQFDDGFGDAGFHPPAVSPGGLIAPRSSRYVLAVSANPLFQEFWGYTATIAENSNSGSTRHVHLAGTVDDEDIGALEPGDLKTLGDGSIAPAPTGEYAAGYNNLLLHDERGHKTYATPILLWKRGPRLLTSTDGGESWSKGYTMMIPVKNGVYATPQTNQAIAGEKVGGFEGVNFDIGLSMSAMVSNGTDVFCATPFSLEGVVFVNLTWDGLKAEFFDRDEIEPIPEKEVKSTAGEGIVFTAFNATVT